MQRRHFQLVSLSNKITNDTNDNDHWPLRRCHPQGNWYLDLHYFARMKPAQAAPSVQTERHRPVQLRNSPSKDYPMSIYQAEIGRSVDENGTVRMLKIHRYIGELFKQY